MMVKFVVFVLAFLAVSAFADDKYTTKYDDIDYKSIIKSDRLLTNYVNCLLEKGRCTPEGNELKRNLPDALQSECSKCSENQRKAGYTIVDFIIENKPDVWKILEKKYDPEGIYIKKYDKELNERKKFAEKVE